MIIRELYSNFVANIIVSFRKTNKKSKKSEEFTKKSSTYPTFYAL
ncbi:hypothetical protein HMPREF3226_00841 [Prevotella corporis]|uniref:Uncharacterized protein n=1 Tax=Prevotella corporis TaxID=28128 RepID=A0A133QF43_9BACT|nr:hypothetical protein HMPREF3226_00841 [Prevotella corporis]